MNSIFLSGGGNAEQSRAIDDEFDTSIHMLNQNPDCLYVPHAMREENRQSADEWFRDTYASRVGTVVTADDLSSPDITSAEYDAMYVGGGNTGRLLDQIKESGFDAYMKAHLDRGKLVYGGSAGAIVLGKTILTTEAVEHSLTDNDGLDLLQGRSVVAHYDPATDSQRVLQLSQSLQTEILAIPEDAGVVVNRAGEIKAVGDSAVWLMRPDGSMNIV